MPLLCCCLLTCCARRVATVCCFRTSVKDESEGAVTASPDGGGRDEVSPRASSSYREGFGSRSHSSARVALCTMAGMKRWAGRVALVTGASAGIGASVARRLVAEGMKVVAVARREDRLQSLAQELKGQPGTLIPVKCDLTKDDEVLSMFAKIKNDLGGVDVCVNNAGIGIPNDVLEGSPKEWREMLDLNVVALCLCTREAVASMRERGVDDGHVIHINSVGGHRLSSSIAKFNFYCATKHMVTVLTEAQRRELKNTNIRVTSISPGVVETEFIISAGLGEEMSKEFFSATPKMHSDDVADTLIHVLAAPPSVQIHEVMLMPTKAD